MAAPSPAPAIVRLKSLSDMLKGKSGRFRQNLLGKRVDYSGRSVIVIGPELKLHQCGLPKKMALVLFEPFIIRRLKELGYVHTVRSAKKMIERQITGSLGHPGRSHARAIRCCSTARRRCIVFPSRRSSRMLIEGEAIRIHPLVCTAYNADFDGDQMAVHVPLSVEAQMEARLLMMAPNNIFSPSSGKPIMTPTQDITLGCYYLTAESARRLRIERERSEAVRLEERSASSPTRMAPCTTHERIRLANPDFGKQDRFTATPNSKVIETTVGRVIFSEIWPRNWVSRTKSVGKAQLGDLIWNCYKICGHEKTVVTLDKLKELGFREATQRGCFHRNR